MITADISETTKARWEQHGKKPHQPRILHPGKYPSKMKEKPGACDSHL
jgi:hypothetical protein